jgi:hypothetical protein
LATNFENNGSNRKDAVQSLWNVALKKPYSGNGALPVAGFATAVFENHTRPIFEEQTL